MSIPPVEPVESIPTKLEALVQLLVNTLRHSLITSRRAVEAQEDSKE
jgi:hypothetical protein